MAGLSDFRHAQAAQIPSSQRGVFVADSTSGLLGPVDRAWFVEALIDPWTGEWDYLAFNMRAAANAYALREGRSVVDWTAVMAEGARRAGPPPPFV